MVDSVVWPLGTRLEPKKALIKKKKKKTKQKESTNKLLVFVQADLVHRSYSQACIYKLAGHKGKNYNKRKASKMRLQRGPF